MRNRAMSRRTILEAGACALVAAAGIPQIAQCARRDRTAFEERGDCPEILCRVGDEGLASDRHPAGGRLHIFKPSSTTTSARATFKAGCWDTQIAFIDRFDLKQVIGTDNEAFVMYVCHTTNGKTFRNVEYFQLRDGKVKAIECYFGGKSSFPSAVSTGKG